MEVLSRSLFPQNALGRGVLLFTDNNVFANQIIMLIGVSQLLLSLMIDGCWRTLPLPPPLESKVKKLQSWGWTLGLSVVFFQIQGSDLGDVQHTEILASLSNCCGRVWAPQQAYLLSCYRPASIDKKVRACPSTYWIDLSLFFLIESL